MSSIQEKKKGGVLVAQLQRGTQRAPSDVWMLDVDGVLVSLMTKRANELLISLLAQRLHHGDMLTFNSGRSPLAIGSLVLSLLEQQIADRALLSSIMVVGEKGGAWAHYSLDSVLQIAFDTSIIVPTQLSMALSDLVEDPDFVDFIEIESGKRTMVSAIKRKGIALDAFQQVQAKFVPRAQWVLSDLGLERTWKIDAVSDLIEIEPSSASKGKGALRIIHWLQGQGMVPHRVIAIEDSPSGISMAETLSSMAMPVEFVFTGTAPLPRRPYPFPITYTGRKYEEGTVEYLQCHHTSLCARG